MGVRCRAVLAVVGALTSLGVVDSAFAATNATAGLKKLLPRAGEMPGFRASGPVRVFRSVVQDIAYDPPALRKSDAANLIKDGFVAEIVQSQMRTGPAKTYGASGLTRLRSHAAAEAYDRFTFSIVAKPGPVSGKAANIRFTRFPVPGVPGAMGVAEIARHKQRVSANLQWVEGSCMVQVGDAIPTTNTPLTKPLIAAARSIFQRTKGSCSTAAPHGFGAK